ncbi:unnamed protein product [Meloidogyne enterolobii]|uniref:Uncharacterized protein n=1 Tax=Meloidogyne enterolobii TaxID=390850 RepID=A0ACB1A2Z0_MELEN
MKLIKKNLLKNKERQEYYRNYLKQNKERINKNQRNYYKRNKEKIRKSQKKYEQNNREKRNEYKRKRRLKKKNVQSDNNEGTSFINPQTDDFTNLVKLSIVCEEEGNLSNQREEECYNGEDEQNQIEVEEKIKFSMIKQ